LELPRDSAEIDHCGSCQACLDICPTAAFAAPYKLDARRCISYLTIENKGPIPREFRKAIGNRIYGCDDCLAACPWNKFAQEGREAKLAARDELRAPELAELAQLDDAAFRALFTKSPVKCGDCWEMRARWCAGLRSGRCSSWCRVRNLQWRKLQSRTNPMRAFVRSGKRLPHHEGRAP
jgi:epoxyqueuosine reductase QueG